MLIDVVWGGGIGGVSRGAVRKHGKYHVITALVVDSDPSAEQTHALSMPHIPTACYNLSNTEESLELLYRHVPKALMCKTFIHVSNSCNHASTGNIQKRDLNKTYQDTDWFLSLLERTGCAVWTLENVPSVLKRYEGRYPTSRRIDMCNHCACAQVRTRMILSNRMMVLPRYTGEQVTMRSVLGDIKGWPKDVKLWQRNSWGDPKSVDEPAYTVTSGAYHMGAPSLGELTSEHNATWEDRARLQMMEPEDIQFPPHTTDTEKCRLVAGAIPPPFARQLSLAAAQFQQEGAKRHSLTAMMLQLAVSEKDTRPVFAGGVEERSGGSGLMHMPEEYEQFQRQTNSTTAVKNQSLRRMKKYVSDWGSNESEWMESAKLFEDACTEVHSQNEVLKQYSTSVLNRTVTDARWGFGDCLAVDTPRARCRLDAYADHGGTALARWCPTAPATAWRRFGEQRSLKRRRPLHAQKMRCRV